MRTVPLVLIFSLLMPLYAGAATPDLQFGGLEPLSISIFPLYPRPNSTMTITVSSTLVDLSAAQIRITVDGTVVAEGPGVRTVAVQTGSGGKTMEIGATATVEGQTHTATLTVRTADVALVMEPISTVPPFYLGAMLPAPEARLRIIAMPDFRTPAGTRIPSNALIYTWQVGQRILQNESGLGKNVFEATAPLRYRDASVTVLITNQEKTLAAQSAISVIPADPVVRVYRNDPLLGVWFEQALSGAISLSGSEETFRVAPFYFDGQPALTWTVNGTTNGTGRDITLRATGQGEGTASVGVTARGVGVAQSAGQNISVRFGNTALRNFFGI